MKTEWEQLIDIVNGLENPNDKHTLCIWIKRIAIFEKTSQIGHFAMTEIQNGRSVVDAIELAMYEWDI